MKRSFRRQLVLSATALSALAAGIVVGERQYFGRSGYSLPYNARFTEDVEDRWTALGGAWEVVDGSMRNDSNEHGAKLLTGAPNWKDYAVEGDLQLLGDGSVGVLARVSEAEVGENSFKGYFAGVRTVDSSFVLGAYDFAYHEAERVVLEDPVRPFLWYHIKLKVDGCLVTASVWAAGRPEVKTVPLNDPDCFRSGSIGLRSNNTGGIWRNVRVTPADSTTGARNSTAENLYLPDTTALQHALLQVRFPRNEPQPTGGRAPPVSAQAIRDLQYVAPFGSPLASIRGSVVLTRPGIYVQDSSGGGVEIQSDIAAPLKIGDEVEVTGEISLDKVIPLMRKARFHLLRETVPVSPLALTANQLAEGQYDGMFVQVEGYLRNVSAETDGAHTMSLDAGPQSFHAILQSGRSWSHVQHLTLGSRLRLRGVPVVDGRFNKTADPFVLLVRSAEDVDLVAGPPGWRPAAWIFASLVGLGLIFIFNHVYLLAKHWQLRAVADERERLAHEIHDSLAQSFAGIGFQLQAIRNSMPENAQVLERQVDQAMSMARTSHEEALRSIASLRPESLGQIGLLPALRACAERMVKSGDVTVETYGEEDGRVVPLHIKDTLFRIGQEAIANSIRHACPDTIRIGVQQQRASLCLSVEDDGRGFVADSDHAGFGLLGMHKRAERISARLIVKSAPGSGTRIEVNAPIGSRFLGMTWMN